MVAHSTLLVFHFDLLTGSERICRQFIGFQIYTVKPHSGYLTVLIGCIIVDALVGVTAAGIDRLLVQIADLNTTLLLRDTS